MKQRKRISHLHKVSKSQYKKIKPPIFKEMMKKSILVSKNMVKDSKDLEKNSKNIRDSKKNKELSPKKPLNNMKKKVNSSHKNNKMRSIINIRISIMIITKQFTKVLKDS